MVSVFDGRYNGEIVKLYINDLNSFIKSDNSETVWFYDKDDNISSCPKGDIDYIYVTD